MQTNHECIKRVLSATNGEELLAGYKEWACGYDKDLKALGYVAPLHTTKALQREEKNTDIRILDAGCGTGLVGECLVAAGFEQLDALDYSPAMLDEARGKNVYSNFFCADMNKPLEFADNTYDAVTCVGAFTLGHVQPEALRELVRITRPEGTICFTVRDEAYHQFDYRATMFELESEGVWELRELRHDDYIVEEQSECKLCTYKVL